MAESNLYALRGKKPAKLSIINDKTIADFARVVEQTGILLRRL